MSDEPVTFHDLSDETGASAPAGIVARIDEAAFDRQIIYAAAFTFIDRAWVRLHRHAPGRVDVVLREKAGGSLPGDPRAELVEALYAARLQQASVTASGSWADSITLSALGSPESDVESPANASTGESAKLDPVAEEDLAAFDDPLGIAKSWEEKHRKPT